MLYPRNLVIALKMFILPGKIYKMEALINYCDKTIIILAINKLNGLFPFTVMGADLYHTSKSALNDIF